MVNFGVGPAFVLGVFLAVAGAGLYFLRSIRPELSRDHDIFFAAVGLVCGLILMFYGWRLEPALQFGQFLLAGTTIFFAYEAIRLRGIATEQARRNTPIVDDERPVSKVYRAAKLDDLDPYEGRRLTGTREPRSDRRSEYEVEDRRSPQSRRRSDRYGTEETPRSRRTRPSPPPGDRYSDPYVESNGSESYEESYDRSDYPPSRSRRPRPEPNLDEPPARPRKRRPRPSEVSDLGTDLDATPVDYQPIGSDDELDNGYNDSYSERDRPSRESNYSDRDSYDPMSYGQPYDDSDEEEEEYDERYDEREERGTPDRFDY